MKKIAVFLIIVCSASAIAGGPEDAMRKTTEAFFKTKTGKEISRQLEKTIEAVIPVEKETATVIGSVALSAAQGKVDTKVIKNMSIDMPKGSIRPDVEFDLKSNDSFYTLKYRFNF